MKGLALWLAPAIAFCGQTRFARLGELEGKAEVQLHAADAWQTAVRNMPLVESSWIRTTSASRLEAELDEGSVLRLGPNSLCEFSDYTRLSTGQRITLLSLDRGLAYFTGEPASKDAVILAVPGAQITIRRAARVRLEVQDDSSQIAIIEGTAQFSSPSAELELKEGQMARVDPARASRFFLYREVSPLDSDRWSEERDKVFASSKSAAHVHGLHFGLNDLDTSGTWIETAQYGTVWKPNAIPGWAPFRNGTWTWYEELGYTWISGDTWGWLPSHYGRWVQQESAGWLWAPGKSTVFKPGDVYWLRGSNFVGWGPLAPGEDWTATSVPRLYLNANTTFAKFAGDAREIDPAGFSARPKDPLSTAYFAIALPSPAFPAARLEAARPVLRAGSTRVIPHLAGVSYEAPAELVKVSRPPEPELPPPAYYPPPPASAAIAPPPPPQPIYVSAPPPVETLYIAPVYTGVVVVNPPERRRQHHPPPPSPVAPAPEPAAPVSRPAPVPPAAPPIERRERQRERPVPAAIDPPATPEAEQKVPRQESGIPRAEQSGRRQR